VFNPKNQILLAMKKRGFGEGQQEKRGGTIGGLRPMEHPIVRGSYPFHMFNLIFP